MKLGKMKFRIRSKWYNSIYRIKTFVRDLSMYLSRMVNGIQCNHEGCVERVHLLQCHASPYDLDEGKNIEWFCYEHAADHGFCSSCGIHCAGIESFDFGRYAGYCDNCASYYQSVDDEIWEIAEDDYDDMLEY